MSCTAVFKSSYAHLFSHWGLVPKGHPLDLSLAILGLTLYTAYFVAGCLWPALPPGFRSRLCLTVAAGNPNPNPNPNPDPDPDPNPSPNPSKP